MKRFRIIVPKHPKKDIWKIIIPTGNFKTMPTAGYVINYLEGVLKKSLASDARPLIHVVVDYDQLHTLGTKKLEKQDTNTRTIETGCEWFNDIQSNNFNELMKTTIIFLEDYLSHKYKKEKYAKYKRKDGA